MADTSKKSGGRSLQTRPAIRREMSRIYALTREGEIEPSILTALSQHLNRLYQMHLSEDTMTQLSQLQAQIDELRDEA